MTAPLLDARDLSAGTAACRWCMTSTCRCSRARSCLVGPNGAGKTTTLLTLAGELPPLSGEVRFYGEVVRAPLHRRARQGLSFVTEERSMLAVGRALSRGPKVLLADELSLGLAPLVGERLLNAIRQAARERGVGVLLVEQHVSEVLRYADRVYVMRRGRVEISGEPGELAGRLSDIEDSYLGRTGARGAGQ